MDVQYLADYWDTLHDVPNSRAAAFWPTGVCLSLQEGFGRFVASLSEAVAVLSHSRSERCDVNLPTCSIWVSNVQAF